MAIHCPACGREIDGLYSYAQWERKQLFSLRSTPHGETYIPGYEELDDYELDSVPLDFECPECQALLFHDENQATKFLQWGDLYPWKGVDDYGQKSSEEGDKGKDQETPAYIRIT